MFHMVEEASGRLVATSVVGTVCEKNYSVV